MERSCDEGVVDVDGTCNASVRQLVNRAVGAVSGMRTSVGVRDTAMVAVTRELTRSPVNNSVRGQ